MTLTPITFAPGPHPGLTKIFANIKGRPFEATAANEEQIGMYVTYIMKKNSE